ncbi:MAG: HTH domain-containing protein [Lunatimonas sp.]|uniref:HTH domain-containing protein n=1 Tax=Lunatimonas sp. TaxID=2060141 RepID=UPI00263A4AC6|nr:HTH domain-containing protein [Lunatimonas sp.]MCC5936684.1 HTH domain-containing protein [Lunatimonas sp.]
MEFIKQIERFQLLSKLIKEERTGSPDELASRLGVSRAKLYLMLDELKDEGAKIRYSKRINSFVFENCDGISIGVSIHILGLEESRKIFAGKVENCCERLIF